MDNTITIGRDCNGCKYYQLKEESKRDVFVHCIYKDKTYFYGQRICCENKEK